MLRAGTRLNADRTMKLKTWLRITALVCIFASTPVAFLTYPWMPATVMEFVDLQHDPAPWGTASYHEGREQRMEHVRLALILYALGTLSLAGFWAIVAAVLPWWLESAAWSLAAVTAFGVSR